MRANLPGILAAVVVCSAGCPTRPADEDAGTGSREGQPCNADGECNGLVCLAGVCMRAGGDAGQVHGSSGGSVSIGGSSSSTVSGASSSAAPDAAVPRGAITTDPATGPLDFGATRLGASVEKTVLVTNTGDGPLAILNVGIRYADSAAPQEFSVQPVTTTPSSLAPGAQFGLRVRYTPVRGDGNHAFLSLASDALNGSLVELELVAGFKGDPELGVRLAATDTGNATELLLGPTPMGSTVAGHLYLLNAGATGSALNIRSVTLSSAGTGAFLVSAGSLPRSFSQFPGACADGTACAPASDTCAAGFCLSAPDAGATPLEALDVTVTFLAPTPGLSTATLTIAADGHGRTFNHAVTLNGTAQVGGLVAVPNPLATGNAFVGYPTRTPLHLQNAGNVPVAVEALDWLYGGAPAPFAVELGTTVLPRTLNPGSAFDVTVVFDPPALGEFSDTLRVHPANGALVTVPVTGSAVEKPTITVPASLDFGDRQAGAAHVLDLVIGNAGPGVLNVSRLSIRATGSSPFTFSPSQLTSAIPAQGSVTLQVTYAPQVAGAGDSASLVVDSDDPARPSATVALSGSAVGPVASVTPSSGILDFGPVAVGTAPAPVLSVVVRNAGVGPLSVATDLTARNALDQAVPAFSVAPDRAVPASVASGGSDALTLACTFAPTANGTVAGTLRLQTNDPARQQVSVTFIGTGVACSSNHIPAPTYGNGACNGLCETGFGDCNNNKQTDGCEASLDDNVNHCGACQDACSYNHITAVCTAGACTGACTQGFDDCNADRRRDGCETEVLYNALNCGGCNQVCSGNNITTPTCGNGTCDGTCQTGFADCNSNKLDDGCEIDIRSNPDRCGGCVKVCSSANINARTCTAGLCTGACNTNFDDCDNDKLSNGCETDLRTSASHCGSCTTVCSNNHIATPTCGANVCNGTCDTGWQDCDGNKQSNGCESNRNTDNNNCGACGTVCAVTAQCTAGKCVAQCGVKINEVQVAGSTALDEFIELYNTCTFSIDVSNWTLRYRSAGNSEANLATLPAGTSLASGAYYVLGNSAYSGTKDQSYTNGLSAAGGAVGIYNNSNPTPTLLDSVSYEVLTAYNVFTERDPAPNPPAANSIQRFPNGADSDDNSADFQVRPARTPRAVNQ